MWAALSMVWGLAGNQRHCQQPWSTLSKGIVVKGTQTVLIPTSSGAVTEADVYHSEVPMA